MVIKQRSALTLKLTQNKTHMYNSEIRSWKHKYMFLVQSLKAQGLKVRYQPAVKESYEIVPKSEAKAVFSKRERRAKQRAYYRKNRYSAGRCMEAECDFTGNRIEHGRHKTQTGHKSFTVRNLEKVSVINEG